MKLKELFSAHDMTAGPPWQRIMEFAVPMLVGNLAQQLYNTADSIVVGHYVGDNALAAVGSASPILNLLPRERASSSPSTTAPGTGSG